MSDEVAAGIHDVRVASLADFDSRDDIPDEFQIHLRHGDAGRDVFCGERHGHVGLRLFSEVDRSEIRSYRFGLQEARVVRKIGGARHEVHGEARHLELKPARGIEQADLCHGRCLAKEPKIVEPALLERRRRTDLCLRGPGDLPLDLFDELLDLGGRRQSLFLLNSAQRSLLLLIPEVHIDQAAPEQRYAHQADEKNDVLSEEPSTRTQGVTSSALRSSEGGIVSPSCLAALRLMRSSNLLGCSTGRAAGLAPFRILSTKEAAMRQRSGRLTP